MGKNGNGDDRWKEILDALAHAHGEHEARLCRLEEICEDLHERSIKEEERRKKEDERWAKNDERWAKNDERWAKNDERIGRILAKLEKHDGHIEALLKELHHRKEGR